MRTTRTTIAVVVVGGLGLTGLFTGCGNDDSTAAKADERSSESTKAAPESQSNPGEPEVDPKIVQEVDKRGEPQLAKTDTPTELKITDDIVGSGEAIKEGAIITVQYSGAAASTGDVFDSSWTRGEPATFPVDELIEGWSKGLLGMKVGGRRTLVVPSEMAYGNGGPAPGDALVFTVDLLGVANQ